MKSLLEEMFSGALMEVIPGCYGFETRHPMKLSFTFVRSTLRGLLLFLLLTEIEPHFLLPGALAAEGPASGPSIKAFGDENWSARFPGPPGVNGFVQSVIVATNGDVYVGGSFELAINAPGKNVAAKNIARWDGSSWSALGSGVDGNVAAMAFDQEGVLYVCGGFNSAGGKSVNNIARWDGTAWASVGQGLNFAPSALVNIGNDIYAGGYFSYSGTMPMQGLARWNGTAWSKVGNAFPDNSTDFPYIQSMSASSEGELLVAGSFSSIGGVSAQNVARYHNGVWSALGSGITGDYVYLQSIISGPHGEIYVGGGIWQDNYSTLNGLMKWDGDRWRPFGKVDSYVLSMGLRGDVLFVAGYFSQIEGRPFPGLARYDGVDWKDLNGGLGGVGFGYVQALAPISEDEIIVGGNFTKAGEARASFVARWSQQEWSALGFGASGPVYAAVTNNQNGLVVAGDFRAVYGVKAGGVAVWDGAQWTPFPASTSSVEGPVLALENFRNEIFAGGTFVSADQNTNLQFLARQSGQGWGSAGGLFDGPVYALKTVGDRLYAGGGFSHVGRLNAAGIAMWDGTNWSAVGGGVSHVAGESFVRCLEFLDGVLYVGGSFDKAGDISARNLAGYDGANWHDAGGLDGVPNALYSWRSSLVAAGNFRRAGDVEVNGIASFAEKKWSKLGSGMTDIYGFVLALGRNGAGNLVMGGDFDQVGGVKSTSFAEWDGSSWLIQSDETATRPGAIHVFANHGGDLWAGGDFGALGSSSSKNIAILKNNQWGGIKPSSFWNNQGFNGPVEVVLAQEGELIVGGHFTQAGGSRVKNIVRWNGAKWVGLGEGINGRFANVHALVLDGGKLYVGGAFETAGETQTSGIALYDLNTKEWTALGAGVSGTVYGLAKSGDDLFAVGNFLRAGTVNANRVARYDLALKRWSNLGTGLDRSANFYYAVEGFKVVVAPGGDVYVGGSYDRAGGKSAKGLARWIPTQNQWFPAGPQLTMINSSDFPRVNALALDPAGTLYAGGNFLLNSGGVRSTNLARLNITNQTWTAAPSGGLGGQYDSVTALTVSAGRLYAAGSFVVAGRTVVNRITRLNGQTWASLGAGISGGNGGEISSISVSGADVYVGGEFSRAGDKPSYNFAHWNDTGETRFQPWIETSRRNGRPVLAWLPGLRPKLEFRESWSVPWRAAEIGSLMENDESTWVEIDSEKDAGFYRFRLVEE